VLHLLLRAERLLAAAAAALLLLLLLLRLEGRLLRVQQHLHRLTRQEGGARVTPRHRPTPASDHARRAAGVGPPSRRRQPQGACLPLLRARPRPWSHPWAQLQPPCLGGVQHGLGGAQQGPYLPLWLLLLLLLLLQGWRLHVLRGQVQACCG
jgi:hypothetical protein